jgi:predicted transcriptional regulator
LIYGKVDKWEGRYIGLEARKKLRLQKIDKLNKEIDKLEERLSFAKENIDELSKKLLILQKEHSEILIEFKYNFELSKPRKLVIFSVYDINNENNLVHLCPNCHWEFNYEKLKLETIKQTVYYLNKNL